LKHRIDDMKTTIEALNVKLVALDVKSAASGERDTTQPLVKELNETWDKLQKKYDDRMK
jgi:hypothetical protein